MPEARDIYQEHLETVSRAIWTRDYARIAEMMHYPHQISTPRRSAIVETPEQLMLDAQAFRENLAGLAATAYHRVCRAAAFDGPDRIVGRHITYVLRGGTYVTDPYMSDMRLVRRDGAWLGAGIVISEHNLSMSYFHPDTLRDVLRQPGDDTPEGDQK